MQNNSLRIQLTSLNKVKSSTNPNKTKCKILSQWAKLKKTKCKSLLIQGTYSEI
jgi:hypothetical protein